MGASREVMDHGLAAKSVVPSRTQSCIGLVGRCAAWCESSRRDEVRTLPKLGGGIVGESGQPGRCQKLYSRLSAVNVRLSGVCKCEDGGISSGRPCDKIINMVVKHI